MMVLATISNQLFHTGDVLWTLCSAKYAATVTFPHFRPKSSSSILGACDRNVCVRNQNYSWDFQKTTKTTNKKLQASHSTLWSAHIHKAAGYANGKFPIPSMG